MTLANSLAVIDVIVHPGFNRSTFANDVALLELVSPSTAGRPIELFADPGGPAALTPALLSGWGETVPGFPAPDQLHATWLYVRAGPTGPCGQWGASYQAAIMLCASGGVSSPDGAGGCRGDSGGPLVVTVSGRPLLAGVVSYGAGGCPNTHSAPTVFARVSTFVSWIRQYAPPAGTLADDVVEVQVTGRPGMPSSGVGAVVVNLTSTGTLSRGFLTAFPCGEVPGVSSLNTVPGRAVASMAVVPVSPAGSICVYSPTATHVIVDLLGWLPG
jgi:secreted trypsin-like serine protease